MGDILVHSEVAQRMYRSLADWLTWLPGGLLHTTVASSPVFRPSPASPRRPPRPSALWHFPTFRVQGYDERWVSGSIASGATVGILIPTSINLIIYSAITETSIGALFLAGFVPEVLLALSFMLTIAIAATLAPAIAGTVRRGRPGWPPASA
jgi:C4-dicarboxylate transporter DctM subunit